MTKEKENKKAVKTNSDKIAIFNPKTETVGGKLVITYDERQYMENCPLNKEELEKLETFEHQYIEAITDKTVDIAIENFKKGELKEAYATAPMKLNDKLATSIIDGKIISTVETDNFMKEKIIELEKKLD